MTDDDNRHYCPACGAPQKHFARYPWYFCNDCCRTASDIAGRRYRFQNVGFSGGFEFAPEDEEQWYTCLGVICLIKGRPAYVHEARFGGIVAEPVPNLPFRRKDVIDIRRGLTPTIAEKLGAK